MRVRPYFLGTILWAVLGLALALAQTDDQAHPLSIEALRQGRYPGSALTIEQTLAPGANYRRYLASYRSEGLKIYGLLTIPSGTRPRAGWPALVFIHGYIPPAQYRTLERYVAYVDGFARAGYIVFKIDLRGHGNSEGTPGGAYWSPDYTIDTLNAFASLRQFPQANPERIGMWGHSMGGYLTLRAMVVEPRIRAGVIWAGVVGTYDDMLNRWRRRPASQAQIPPGGLRRRELFLARFGSPQSNPGFWNAITAHNYLEQVSPIQIHHGIADAVVPVSFSQRLAQSLREARRPHELYTYPGNDHNLSQSFSLAMQRSIAYLDRHLKR
jgi:dipeptidyl aminopeptidase/acylaminoacyl peptidase